MFKDSLSSLAANWIPATILFLVFVLSLSALIHRQEIPALAKGLARIVSLVVFSPLLYLRKLILEVADAQRREEKDSLSSDQFLIRRQFATAKAGLIVGSLALLASGFAASWGMLPSRQNFRELREAKEWLAKKEVELVQLRLRPSELDEAWLKLRARVMPRWFPRELEELLGYRKQRMQLEASLPQELTNMLSPDSAQPTLENYGDREAAAASAFSQSEVLSGNATAADYFARLDWERQRAEYLAQQERGYRAQGQPEWSKAQKAIADCEAAIGQQRAWIAELEGAIKTRRRVAVVAFLWTLVFFYVVVWLVGLFIEVTSLAVRVAGDIRALRERRQEAPAEEAGQEVSLSRPAFYQPSSA